MNADREELICVLVFLKEMPGWRNPGAKELDLQLHLGDINREDPALRN